MNIGRRKQRVLKYTTGGTETTKKPSLIKGGAPRADLPAGKSVRHACPVNRCECHTRIKRVMRHVPSSPAGTPAGGKTGNFAGQPITDRFQGQPRLKLTVL